MIMKEDFKKLKQLDRIEYMLRLDGLNKKKNNLYFPWLTILFVILGIMAFVVLLSFQLKILGLEDSFAKIFLLIIPLTRVGIFVGIFGAVWNIIHALLVFPKWDKKLDEEYFKIEVKPKT